MKAPADGAAGLRRRAAPPARARRANSQSTERLDYVGEPLRRLAREEQVPSRRSDWTT